jgi:hypothetical protein
VQSTERFFALPAAAGVLVVVHRAITQMRLTGDVGVHAAERRFPGLCRMLRADLYLFGRSFSRLTRGRSFLPIKNSASGIGDVRHSALDH